MHEVTQRVQRLRFPVYRGVGLLVNWSAIAGAFDVQRLQVVHRPGHQITWKIFLYSVPSSLVILLYYLQVQKRHTNTVNISDGRERDLWRVHSQSTHSFPAPLPWHRYLRHICNDLETIQLIHTASDSQNIKPAFSHSEWEPTALKWNLTHRFAFIFFLKPLFFVAALCTRVTHTLSHGDVQNQGFVRGQPWLRLSDILFILHIYVYSIYINNIHTYIY